MSATVPPISLNDLRPVTVTMRVVTPYGREIALPVMPLTWHEWNEIGGKVSNPNPDDPRYKTRWNEAKKQKEFDPQNEDYRKAGEDATSERSYRRLLLALEKAGNHIEGDSIEEKLKAIEEIEVGVGVALINKLGEISMGGRVSVETLAESFRGGRVPADEGADMPPEGLDAGAVG